jgi:hypothetical protein
MKPHENVFRNCYAEAPSMISAAAALLGVGAFWVNVEILATADYFVVGRQHGVSLWAVDALPLGHSKGLLVIAAIGYFTIAGNHSGHAGAIVIAAGGTSGGRTRGVCRCSRR